MRWWHNVKSISENRRTKRRMIRNAKPLNEPLHSLAWGFYKLKTSQWRTRSIILSQEVNETNPEALKGWNTAWISPGCRSAFVSFTALFCEPRTYSSVFLGCGLHGLCGRKEVGHRCGLRFSSVHASPASSCGPAEMWTGLARTKCFHLPQGHLHSSLAGGGRLTCQDTGPGLWASGRGHALRA